MRCCQNAVRLVLMMTCLAGAGLPQATAQSSRASEPKDVMLQTKDGVKLAVTYYASNVGQDAVPVVILHDHKESRVVFDRLAFELQSPSNARSESRAVITVDLRGHGQSTSQIAPNGQQRKLDASRLKTTDYQKMVTFDMEAVRKFLVDENDLRQLNLNKLCLVGSGMGASVAVSWAATDWSAPRLAIRKQGQDVKAMFLVSPQWKYRGLSMLEPLRQPGVQRQISMFIAYGEEDSKASKSAENIYKNLAKYHPEPDRDQIREKKDLFLFPLPTKLQGTKLLTTPDFGLYAQLEAFIEARLGNRDFEWIRRRSD